MAQAVELGVGRDVLRGPGFRTLLRGVRVPATAPDTLETLCAAASLLLPPDAAFDGATALALHRLPLPRTVTPDNPLHVRCREAGQRVVVQGIRSTVGPVHSVQGGATAGRLRVTAQAWLVVAADPRVRLDDLVVLGDAIAARREGLAALRTVVAKAQGRRGVQRVRRALDEVRTGVDSPQETRTRLLLVRAGIPEPVCGRDVFVDEGMTWVSRPDLSWPLVKVALEYDGGTHDEARQRTKDAARNELMADFGWRVLVVTSDDLRYRRQPLVHRVESTLRARGLTW